jgi:hypothetical protein
MVMVLIYFLMSDRMRSIRPQVGVFRVRFVTYGVAADGILAPVGLRRKGELKP